MAVVRPAMVVSAFSSELFLKCLIVLEGGRPPASHDLKHLYSQLSGPRRQRIKQLWNEAMRIRRPQLDEFEAESRAGDLRRDIEGALKQAARAFEDNRYFYEKTAEEIETMNFLISDLPIVLKIAVWDIKPQWIPPKGQRRFQHTPRAR